MSSFEDSGKYPTPPQKRKPSKSEVKPEKLVVQVAEPGK